MTRGNVTTGPSTSVGLLADRARRYPDRPFVASMRAGCLIERFTYREGVARIVGIADWLRAFGLAKGDAVVTYLDVGDPGLWFYLGCAAVGVLPVPIGPAFSVDAVRALAKQSRAKAVFTLPELAGRLSSLGLPILVMSATPTATPPGSSLIEPRPVADPLTRIEALAAAIGPDDLYMYQATSGSTGVPKLVMRRNITFPYAGRVISAGLGPESEPQIGLVTQSLTHGGGHYSVHVLLHLGGCICLPTNIDVAVSLEEVEVFAPTYIYLAPRIMRALIEAHHGRYDDAAAGAPFCGGRLQWVTIGGAPPDEALLAEVEAGGIHIVEGYGATEISVIAVTERGNRRPGWIGKVLPDVEARIAEDGEVMVRSAYRMAGYYENEALTREAFDDEGYYHTGDLGEIDEAGYLRIRGRKRDVFNSSEGSNIYPARIEEMLESLPSIRQVILIGDARPYLSALVVPATSPTSNGQSSVIGQLLEPATHRALYDQIVREIATVNPRLEGFERIRCIALFAGPFPASVYQTVGQAKVRRDRKKVIEHYASVVARLYDREASRGMVVPDEL